MNANEIEARIAELQARIMIASWSKTLGRNLAKVGAHIAGVRA